MSLWRRTGGLRGAPTAADAELAGLFEHAPREPTASVAKMNNVDGLNATHQADLLSLPQDADGSRYSLVVVDVSTRRVGVAPLRTKSAAAVLAALQSIYDLDPVLNVPRRLECDRGKEFHGPFAAWLKAQGTSIRYGEPGRHRQQEMVESVNRILGRAIFIVQSARELESGRPDRNWVADLPPLVDAINKRLERPAPALPSKMVDPAPGEARLLDEGQLVQRVLDRPQGVLGNKLPPGGGKTGRRAQDPTFERRKRAIKLLILRPGMSPRYILDGLPDVSYARHELKA